MAIGSSEYLRYNEPLAAAAYQEIGLLSMAAAETVIGYSSSGNIDFTVLGILRNTTTGVYGDESILAMVTPGATSETDIYTVPAGYDAVVRVVVCNTGSAGSFRLAHCLIAGG